MRTGGLLRLDLSEARMIEDTSSLRLLWGEYKVKLLSGALASAFMLVSVAASAKDMPPPPSDKPDFAKVRATAEQGIKTALFDPSSAQITYTSGFQWGYSKPIIGKKTWGWIACGTLNAKNRMGGYVGAKTFWILSNPAGAVTWDIDNTTFSTCDAGQSVPLQPELKDVETAKTSGPASLGVAEELGKLADLRAKGVLTQAEFDAQKAKLLSR